MNIDVLVVGNGIQALILTKYLKEQGVNVKCLSKASIGGVQTLQSQFYLHRGHFYENSILAGTLNRTYHNWVSLLKELKLPCTIDQSYIGFNSQNEEDYWLSLWEKNLLPHKKESHFLPPLLKESKGHSFFKIPHTLFSGQELIERLTHYLLPHLLVGKIAEYEEINEGLQKITICNDKSSLQIKTPYTILCTGSENIALLQLMKPYSQPPKMQRRDCLTVTLEGGLPNMSILLPGMQMFIAPQYHQEKVYWLYTYGTDQVITEERKKVDTERLKNQLHVFFDFFPSLQKKYNLNLHAYNSTKIENATENKLRPNQTFVKWVGQNLCLVWPTKLTLAFEASHEIYEHIKNSRTISHFQKKSVFQDLSSSHSSYMNDIKIGSQKFLLSDKKNKFDVSHFYNPHE